MNVLEFMHKHIIFSFMMGYLITQGIYRIIHKIIRAISISKNGYPPPHCDGDGDFRSVEKDES